MGCNCLLICPRICKFALLCFRESAGFSFRSHSAYENVEALAEWETVNRPDFVPLLLKTWFWYIGGA